MGATVQHGMDFAIMPTRDNNRGLAEWEIYAGLSDQESQDFGWLEALARAQSLIEQINHGND